MDSIPIQYLKEVQNDSVLLRFLYAHKFMKEETVNYFVDHLDWLNNPETTIIDDLPQYDKIIQIIGRDEMLRPVLHINLCQPLDNYFIKAITNKLILMEDYMFAPSKVESWIIIIDMSQFNPNVQKEYIEQAVKHFITNFPMSLEHIYFLDASQILRQVGENLLSQKEFKIFDLDDKISIMNKAEFKKDKLQLLSPEYNTLFVVEDPLFQQASQKSLSQLIINQPQPTLYGQTQKGQQNADLIGPLYPLVVYAVSQPQPYVPEIHDKELQCYTNQKQIPTFFLDTQNQFCQNYQPFKYNNTSGPQNQQQTDPIPQQQTNKRIVTQLQSQMTFQNTEYSMRTKYDDIIDQYNWNKYGIAQQQPIADTEKIIYDATYHDSSQHQINTPYIQQTPTLPGTEQTIKKFDIHNNQDIHSTGGFFEDPILPQHDNNNVQPSFYSDQKHLPIKHFDFENNSPQLTQPQRNIYADPRSPLEIDQYPPIHQQIEKKFDFGPIPVRPSEQSYTPSYIASDKPYVPERISDIPTYQNNYLQQQRFHNIPTSSLPQTSGYSPYLPQTPFSPLPSSTNLYVAPTYPLTTTNKSYLYNSTQPKIIEQDGIKFQDETMVIGDPDHRPTKNSNRDPALDQQQCQIF
ncbi:unnamed protein product (macronuclear) [Paramecium tetraurelia]|uniref:CRAL-TRIO domain-containing protein n=1 Tax=Paramecium tetraurelia TaxID=5888 RepID=A0D7L8_PARTE|nr:uncharacterized protein GSPATT00014002001 [Paramecium tetraurelia]CAK79035.1 unnamed protein product [Paramecium tetraurelia]|eukprot:XP_001446432.1 hypothetical protein (macronuclear) [Paramecium tetraurelia strain d4-2]